MSTGKSGSVNKLFTMSAYVEGMVWTAAKSFRKIAMAWLALVIAILMPATASAQDATVDWANANAVSLTSLPSGTTVAGSDGTTATVDWGVTLNGSGSFTPAFATDFVSYFGGQIGNGQSPLFVGFNNASYDPGDKITVTITLSRAVGNLRFSLDDIDAGNYVDAIEVYYDDDTAGVMSNATSNPAFWSIGSFVARTNDATVNGWRGVGASDQFASDGTISFAFGEQAVRRIRVVYYSYTGTGDPGNQYLGLSDLTYQGPGADLSLSKALVGSPPVQGGTATWRLTVSNSVTSTQTPTGIVVRDTLPAGFSFVSSSGTGSFNSATGDWSVGSLAPGNSVSLTITGTVSSAAGTTITNTAQITASSANDPDSTVNNGVTTEDDYASFSFVVQSGNPPGIPPTLSCPAGSSIFDWDRITTWTPGSVDNSYAFSAFGNVRFQLTNNGAYINNAAFGGQSPTVANVFTGGLQPAQNSLTVLADQPNRSGVVQVTITLPRAFSGVQFSIYDVDFASGQFTDRVQVTGRNSGTTVNPILTNGNVNTVSGNTATGTGASNSDQALGNVVVTFNQAVDTIVLTYGNAASAPVDPGQQGIGLHDITVCNPSTTLSVTKVSSVISDPINDVSNPKAIPGAIIEYLITVSNTGGVATDANSVVVTDDGPADAKMCFVSRTGGPVIFGAGSSNVSYTFSSLASTTDSIAFSNDNAATFAYTPTADADGCDQAITDFRVVPSGAFSGGGSFTIRVRYKVE